MAQKPLFLVSASYDLTISVTDLSSESSSSAAPLKFILQNAQANRIIKFAEDRFAVASNPYIFIYNRTAKTNKPYQNLQGHQTNVTDLFFDGNRLYSCSEDETWKIWDPSQSRPIASFMTGCCLNTICLMCENKLVLTGNDNGKVEVWNSQNGKLLSSTRFSQKAIRSIVPSNHENDAIIGCQDGTVVIASVTPTAVTELRRVQAHDAFITRVAASPDGKLFATASSDSTAKLWWTETCELAHKLEDQSQTRWVWDVAFTPNSQFVCTGGTDKVCRVWNAQTGALLRQIERHQKGVTCIAVI
ncbi:WD repeat protein [Histomonas meleagridis]|uniref:WD repeat protein n=1 Tax=Histomonas meleagridis TaxID=135588 RepID=UPI003559AB7C|nr:WD repeat protein [Histomonas meleagridis]KAH0798529.1 WD repeat protein [Histomonas meleagridis]